MNKTLIALSSIAAGYLYAGSPAIAQSSKFEADDATADKLIAEGKAKLYVAPVATPEPGKGVKLTKVRLLMDGQYGKCNDVVELDADALKAAEAAGHADSNKAAVAYAMTLEQNQPSTKQVNIL